MSRDEKANIFIVKIVIDMKEIQGIVEALNQAIDR